ncbi:MAG: cytochrome c family protein [Alphaproteobacteria bacterium]|nr:cytochrome c family protein [Alphaproteobacteria bacterium]
MTVTKFFGAFVVAIAAAYLSGFLADKAVHSEELSQNAYPIEVTQPAAPAKAQTIIVASADDVAHAVEAAAEEAAPAAESLSLIEMIASADVEKGKKLSRACAACHSFDKGGKNMTGPNQWGVLGRAKGSVEGFKYSDAIKGLGGTWTYEDLDAFLAKPKAFAPGTKMTYAGLKKPEDRAALIAWLRLQSDSPLPLE